MGQCFCLLLLCQRTPTQLTLQTGGRVWSQSVVGELCRYAGSSKLKMSPAFSLMSVCFGIRVDRQGCKGEGSGKVKTLATDELKLHTEYYWVCETTMIWWCLEFYTGAEWQRKPGVSAKEADDSVCAPCPLKERKSVVPLMQRGRVNVKRQVGTGRPPQYPEGSPLGDKCRYILMTECRPMWEVPSKKWNVSHYFLFFTHWDVLTSF